MSESKRRSLQLQPLHLLTSSSPPPSPAPRRQSSIIIPFRPPSERREPVTLVEKHGDLLQFIAQKESKCLELRSQLAVHEAELLELKRKWERIVSRGFERQQATTAPSTPTASSGTLATTNLPTSAPPTSSPAQSPQPSTLPIPTAPGLEDISSWITTNIPKKWDTATLSKRASMFGQSIAQALDLGDPTYRPLTSSKPATPSTPQPTKPSLSRTGSQRAAKPGSLRTSRLNTSYSPTSTLTDSPMTSSPTSSTSKQSSPPPSAKSSPPAPLPTTKQPTVRSNMSLARTQEENEDEDEAWNW